MPFNLFPILWRLLLLRMNKLLNFHYFFRNFTCNSPTVIKNSCFATIFLRICPLRGQAHFNRMAPRPGRGG